MQEELQVTLYIFLFFFFPFSILSWHLGVRDKPSALQMIRPLPQHTLRRGKVAERQLDLSSWQHIFADYAKPATFSFRGTSQLFPLPCQSRSQTCNRFHLRRASSAAKGAMSTRMATKKQREKFSSNPSRTAPTLPANRDIMGCQRRDQHRKPIFCHHIRC